MIWIIIGLVVAFVLLYYAEENRYIHEWEKFQREHGAKKV